MEEKYNQNNMRPVHYALSTAQAAISAIVVKGEEHMIDYRKDNPELYKLYMLINECAVKAYELTDS